MFEHQISRGAWSRDAYDLGTLAAVRASLNERNSVLELSLRRPQLSTAVSKDITRRQASQKVLKLCCVSPVADPKCRSVDESPFP